MTNRKPTIIDALESIGRAAEADRADLAKGIGIVISALTERRREFEERKARIEKTIKNGAKLTEHEISL